MTREKVLTITIPSYNVERYLENILSKLMSSKYLDLLDVIIVDDGSKDNTALLANEIAAQAPNSVRVISKVNGGHGSTINVGIKNAKGKYFKVVDADDWLDPVSLDEVVQILRDEDTDLLLTPYWTFDDVSKVRKLVKSSRLANENGQRKELIDATFTKMPEFHQHIVKSEILKTNQIVLDENAYYVDSEFIIFPVPFVESYKYVDIPLYVYRINVPTQSTSLRSMIKNGERHGFVIDQIEKYIESVANDVPSEKLSLMVNTVSRMIAAQLKIISLGGQDTSTRSELKRYYNLVRTNYFFNFDAINLPIKLLIKSNMRLYMVVRFLTWLKSKLVRV